jgi:hypothetical protein
MLDIFTVSFFGHREINRFREVERQVESLVLKLIDEKDYVDFLVGRNGEFDQIAATIVRRVKEYYRGNSSLIWVMPYETAEYRENKKAYDQYYDEVETCPESDGSFPKAAYQIRNRSMVDRSDLVIFYVTHTHGGAFQTMQYAKSIGKSCINISDLL